MIFLTECGNATALKTSHDYFFCFTPIMEVLFTQSVVSDSL